MLLVVAGAAAFLRVDAPVFLQALAELRLCLLLAVTVLIADFLGQLLVFLEVVEHVVIQIINFLERAQVLLRSAVALKAEGHTQALVVMHLAHLMHVAVTAFAGNTTVHVGLVAEVGVVRKLMDTHPLDWLTIVVLVIFIHRTAQRLKLRVILLNVLVAVPAGVSGRHTGTGRLIHGAVAVATIDSELVRVQIMIVCNRLIRLITNTLCLRRCIVGKGCRQPQNYKNQAYRDLQRQQIGPSREKISHDVARFLEIVKNFTSKIF